MNMDLNFYEMPSTDYCFARKAKKWMWASAFVIIVLLVVSSAGFVVDNQRKKDGVNVNDPAMQQVRWVAQPAYPRGANIYAVTRRPYGGQYNTFSPQSNPSVFSPVKPVLIKEFAMEVVPLGNYPGLMAHSVYTGGNAFKAGLRNGDIIVKFNGHTVKSLKNFRAVVAMAAAESWARISFIRNGKKIKSSIMVGEGEMEGVTVPVAWRLK